MAEEGGRLILGTTASLDPNIPENHIVKVAFDLPSSLDVFNYETCIFSVNRQSGAQNIITQPHAKSIEVLVRYLAIDMDFSIFFEGLVAQKTRGIHPFEIGLTIFDPQKSPPSPHFVSSMSGRVFVLAKESPKLKRNFQTFRIKGRHHKIPLQ